ncbi:cupin domain-containing protein [Sulfitobacter sp. AS92]|uniref:cupin domain-containing protein n=1 Tax=Sulfitobacter sp. AS92 TaxID=3135783 RepID=UPI003176D132
MFMSVVSPEFDWPEDTVIAAHWRRNGDQGAGAPLGTAAIGWKAGAVGFLITRTELAGDNVLGCARLDIAQGDWALRVDEVAFPEGAIAHRHTHSGSGWRHLVSGELRIETTHGTTVMKPGDSWFEPAQTPVRAGALQQTGVTRFVRCMAIPLADVGRSTFQLVSPEDAALPRLQATHRHIDHPIQVDAG